jgi:hypothetical protein
VTAKAATRAASSSGISEDLTGTGVVVSDAESVGNIVSRSIDRVGSIVCSAGGGMVGRAVGNCLGAMVGVGGTDGGVVGTGPKAIVGGEVAADVGV